MKKESTFDFSSKREPYAYQLEAIEYIKGKPIVALFDEQGTGKTKIITDALIDDFKKGFIEAALIVCKKSLIFTWKSEINADTYIEPVILIGGKNKRGSQFMGLSTFYIIGYETLIQEQKKVELLLKIKKFAIVLDESHKIKNPSSKITQTLFKLCPLAVKRVIISGTPIANRPVDLWSQFYFLDQGKLLGKDFNNFQKKYNLDLKGTKLNQFSNRLKELKEIVSKNSIRRLKNNVLKLPNKEFVVKFIQLEGKQKSMYEQLKKELFLEIKNMNNQTIIDESQNIFKKLLRLVQIASNPLLIDKSYNEEPAKFKLLDQLINEIIKKNEKAIVWTSFVDNIIILKNRYKKYGSLVLYGAVPIEERHQICDKFKNNKDNKILIANPAAAKEGLTLTSANHALYLDRNFKLDDWLQSQDRIHRISQIKACFIIKIIAMNTIDQYIDEILEKKHLISQYIHGDIKELKDERDYLTKEELLKILG